MHKCGIFGTLPLIVSFAAATSVSAGEVKVVREHMTIESHKLYGNKVTRQLETLPQTIDVTVYRPDDGQKHPAVVYLHGGGMSFADESMVRFHEELVRGGIVVLAPHYLLDGTGWPHWHETAVKTVTLAVSLPSVDPDRIGMSGISMGGQVALSTAARDPRIKKVAEFFTSWPGTLPDEPVDKLPPVLLLNGTADPIIPVDWALQLDGILTAHHLPFERHMYEGLAHGFGHEFNDGVHRTAAFFWGSEPQSAPIQSSVSVGFFSGAGQSPAASTGFIELGEGYEVFDASLESYWWVRWQTDVLRKKSKRLVRKKPATTRPVVA